MSISTLRQIITDAGGTPGANEHGYTHIGLTRELIRTLGGTPTQFTRVGSLRELITAAGGTPTKWTTTGLMRELVTALGGTATSYSNDALWDQVETLGFAPANLLVNGDASSGTTGWTASASNLTNVAGKLRVAVTGANEYAYQAITTEIGATYRLLGSMSNVIGSIDAGRIRVGTFALDSSIASTSSFPDVDQNFVATATSTFITLFPQASGVGSLDYDNLSVTEA